MATKTALVFGERRSVGDHGDIIVVVEQQPRQLRFSSSSSLKKAWERQENEIAIADHLESYLNATRGIIDDLWNCRSSSSSIG
ncbi:unnamed protein product [Sphagnum compactum]